MFSDKDDDPAFKWFFGAMPIVLGLVFMSAIFFAPKPTSPPKNEFAFGCYTNELAPPIKLDASGMHILQAGFQTIPFHIEWQKTGFALSADQPIQETAANDRFAFSFYHPGEGTYLHFFHIVNGQSYGVVDEAELSSFTVLANDGTYLAYVSSPKAACDTK